MTVKFYSSFSKRLNSTLQPSGSGTVHYCKLKANCSEHDPVLILSTNAFTYTYAYISDWGKYYFVRDVVSLANNLVEYHLVEDVLATYKTDIGATQAHIVFSSSDYNKLIIDPRIQVLNSRTLYGSVSNSYVIDPNSAGAYLLTVFNTQHYLGDHQMAGAGTGFSVTYMLDQAGFDKLRQWFSDITMVTALANYFNGNPLDGVISCKWIPYYIPSALLDNCTYIHIANSQSPAFGTSECYVVDGWPTHTLQFSLDVNIHYRGGTPVVYGNDFRAAEPYTCGDLYLPGVGVIEMCMKDWYGESKIYVDLTYEICTGNAKYFIKNSSGRILQTAEVNLASDVPLAKLLNNAQGIINGLTQGSGGVVNMVGGIASENPIMAASGGGELLAGVANAVLSTLKKSTTIIGSLGSRTIQYDPYIRHTEYCVDTQNYDIVAYRNLRGLPCDGCRQISTLSGYVQCEGASVDCSANIKEKQEINIYLNSGFYYE